MTSLSRRIPDLRRERGQTMVEFALVVPILCVILFGIVQFGILYRDYVALTDAVRAGARKAAVSRLSPTPEADAEAKLRDAASDLQGDLRVTVSAPAWEHGEPVTVEATYPWEINVPFTGIPLASGRLKSATTERIE